MAKKKTNPHKKPITPPTREELMRDVTLTVTHRADGQWHGRSTVPVLTDIQRELFQQAKANEPILCRRGKPKYPWWRKEIEQNV